MSPRIRAAVLLAYVACATLLYLYPFQLRVTPSFHMNQAAWSVAPPGIDFTETGVLRTEEPPTRLHAALSAGSGLTVDAWVTTRTLDQSGPARIVTYSEGAAARNFTLGQEGAALVFRLRTAADDPNGLAGVAMVPDVFVPGQTQLLAVTYDLTNLQIFVDGRKRAAFARPAPDLGAWAADHFLAIGNELTGDRPWRGAVATVALHDRAIDPAEIQAAFQRGPPSGAPGAVASYDFTIGPAGLSGTGPTGAALERPPVYLHGIFAELLTRRDRRPEDFAFNFGIFAGMGALLVSALPRRTLPGPDLLIAVFLVVLIGTTFEWLQFYVEDRTSSLRDLAAAVAGGLAGVLLGSRMQRVPERR